MSQHLMIVFKFYPKHCPGENLAYNANDLNFFAAFCHLNEKSESLFPIKLS